jgi:hypothetical protein
MSSNPSNVLDQRAARDASDAAVDNFYRRVLKDDASPDSSTRGAWTRSAPGRERANRWFIADSAA